MPFSGGNKMSRTRNVRHALAAALVMSMGAVVLPTALAGPAEAATRAKIVRWIDGDTVVTTRGTIRLVGVDTPERGRCGYAAATRKARRVAPNGSFVRIIDPRSVQNKDAYGRLLRYVNRGSRDVGAAQIKAGARARYDSRDGYAHHPRQARYRGLDARHRDYRCAKSSGQQASGSVRPNGWNCPAHAPIKGNASSMIYHRPGQAYYDRTKPEECFRNAASAVAAGYRAAKI